MNVDFLLKADLPEVRDIDRECFDEPAPEKVFTFHMRKDGHYAEVVQGERLMGYSLGEQRQGGIFISRLAVHPDERRKGAGTALVASAIQRAAKQEDGYVFTLAHERNMPGLMMLKANGFVVSAVLPGREFGRGGQVFLMQKHLRLPEVSIDQLGLEKYLKEKAC